MSSKVITPTESTFRNLTNKELSLELKLQKQSGIEVNDISQEGNKNAVHRKLTDELLRIGRAGIVAKTPAVMDALQGIPSVFAVLGEVRLTSTILSVLTNAELRGELKNQGLPIPTYDDEVSPDSDTIRTGLVKALLNGLAQSSHNLNINYTPPLTRLMENLTCPTLFGVEVEVRTGNESVVLMLNPGDLMALPMSVIQGELTNQNLPFNDDDSKIVLISRLLTKFRTTTDINKDFSGTFQKFINSKALMVQESAQLQLQQALQSNPRLLTPQYVVRLDETTEKEIGASRPGATASILSSQAKMPQPAKERGVITGTQITPLSAIPSLKKTTKLSTLASLV